MQPSAVTSIRLFSGFTRGSVKLILRGNRAYWTWLAFLGALVFSGVLAYSEQVRQGLGLTAMRDQVSWGFYIGNFTFLVGVAAAAVVLVIPAYIYNWKPIREIVIYGELLAISAITMCLLFVMVDIGRPDRFWHLIPPFGYLNFPRSVLAWDVLVLNLYFLINFSVATHILYRAFHGKHYLKRFVVPMVLLSVPMAVGIHTVTAFLYNGLAARPYWNSSILAPQFLASAFCSGPAILLIVLQVLRRFTRFEIQDAAIWKVAELMAYAMFLNLFLHGAEAFKEFYSNTQHLLFTRYWYFGVGGHHTLVPYAWSAVALNLASFALFISPVTRRNFWTLNIGCLATYAGVYIEKGMGLIIPGLTPDTLGEIYEYYPTLTELRVAAGIFALGFLVFTLMLKVAVPISLGEFMGRKEAAPEPALVR
ncbi:MAG TPA: NrfD/PsrC family molybdoenzyme membrane anchor subunit [Candidatus Acidoferrales bacterium]|nr:NrfD/PsrC family molybdoenzyme membrane anchor subunit [Candidatus Acidoferrales bacterium]